MKYAYREYVADGLKVLCFAICLGAAWALSLTIYMALTVVMTAIVLWMEAVGVMKRYGSIFMKRFGALKKSYWTKD